MTYKALTLTQPWATLVMLQFKKIETRKGLYKHRGDLAIHAAFYAPMFAAEHRPSRWLKVFFPQAYTVLRRVMTEEDIDALPRGSVLGLVDVVDGCHFTDMPFPKCVPFDWAGRFGEFEESFGDYRPRRGGLLLERPRELGAPVPARGMNGLWNWTPDSDLFFLKNLDGVERAR